MNRVFLCLAVSATCAVAGCSVALDFDALDRGRPDSDTGSEAPACVVDADCDDGVDCTMDACGDDGFCLASVPDNDLCGHLMMCKRGQGCVPTGDECEVAADCDDGVMCTKDRCDIGQCFHIPQNELCDSPNPCIVGDLCDTEAGCLPGTSMTCEQHLPGVDLTCHTVECDPSTGACDLLVLQNGADDDSDSSLDEFCGGDDCNDQDADENPAAIDLCDFRDNDCDGLTDLAGAFAPATLSSGPAGELLRPAVASDGEHLVVAWQVGVGDEADIHVAFLDSTGQAVTGEASLAVLLGTSAGVSLPTLASEEGKVLLAFVEGQEENPSLRVVGLQADKSHAAAALTQPDVEVASGRKVLDVALVGDPEDQGGQQWAALLCVELGAAEAEVAIATPFDLLGAGPAVVASGELREVELELLRTAPGRYAAIMSMSDPTVDNAEVWVSEVAAEEGQQTVAAAPFLVSSSHQSLVDPSFAPRSALVGDRPLLAFGDVAVAKSGSSVEAESDVRAVFLDASDSIATLLSDNAADQRPFGAVSLNDGLGLVFGQTSATDATLDFRAFSSHLTVIGDQAGRIASVHQGQIAASRLMETHLGLALAWVERTSSKDTVRALAFAPCELP